MKKIKHFTTIEEDLLLLQQKGKDKNLSIEEILAILSEKGPVLMILFLSLPFCQPIQIPGFSTPFGLLVAFFGLKIAFGKGMWLPKKLLEKRVNPATLQKITESCLWFLQKVRRWIHPRLIFICHNPIFEISHGVLIFFLGIFLALPLPIPFSNLIAAWSIFFMGIGLLEDDGVFVIISYIFSFITLLFLAFTLFFLKVIF
ncbi:MAG TPA: exopolysaccharide biosynthesis protein [Parachlamydiaceae bacterium]|nr:exopolysaccharide biosynthesis protein [Parachlamydiaceae bacterium]